jgi:hypothetical protein
MSGAANTPTGPVAASGEPVRASGEPAWTGEAAVAEGVAA